MVRHLRPRAGVLVTPTALLYVTGGLAVAGIKTDGVLSGFTAASAPTSVAWGNDQTRFGWVVGAGVEARLGGNWTGKLEGLYMDYGSFSGSPVAAHQQLRHCGSTTPRRSPTSCCGLA